MKFFDFIENNKEDISNEWIKYAQENIDGAKNLQLEEVQDDIIEMLERIVESMKALETDSEQQKKSKGNQDMQSNEVEASHRHGSQRFGVGFDVVELSSEFRALRASVLRLWEEKRVTEKLETDFQDMIRFNEAIDEVWIISLERFHNNVEESKNWFMGILAHDLRNPLSVISGVQSLLTSSTVLSEDQKPLVGALSASVKRMTELIDNLMELTNLRLGSGMSINKTTVDLSKLAEKIVQEVQLGYPEAELIIESSGPIQGKWDNVRLNQLMTNLLSNALKHGKSGSPVRVSVSAKDNEAFLKVHNEGSPIPKPIKDMISSGVFAKTDGDPTKNDSYGLGLYIVNTIVDGHDGQLAVASNVEEGTTFKVMLPIFS